MSDEGQNIGTARIDVIVDTTKMDAAIESAKTRISGMSAQAQSDYAQLSAAQKRATDSALTQADAIGKTREEMTLYRATLKGLPVSILDELKAKLVASQQAATDATAALSSMGAAQAGIAAQASVENDARAAQEARFQAVMAKSVAEQVAANEAVAASNAETTATYGVDAAAFNAAVLKKNASITELNAAMATGIPDIAALTEAEVRLDAAMAAGALSAREQQTYLTALTAAEERLTGAKIGETAVTDANTVATEANTVAKGINSRTAYSLSALITDAATGQFSRSRREVAALANETGVLSKVFTVSMLPILGVTAAVVALGVAYAKGSEETSAYNKAILLTGNYAGQTSDSLANMAKSLSGYGTTEHTAAAALTEVAASGKFTASQIELVGKAALDMAEITGQSTKATIKQFESLQGSPLKAVTALDDAQHFLTTTVYEQIRALEEQGRTQDAADLAATTYASHISDVASESVKNLGLIEQSWNGIKGATKAAMDAAFSIGRPELGQEKFNGIFNDRQALIGQRDLFNQNGATAEAASLQPKIDAYTKQLAELQTAKETADKAASHKSLASQSTLALEDSDKEAALYDTKEQKRVKETLAAYNTANEQIEKAVAAGDTATAERIAQNYVKINEGIAAKYATKAHKSRAAGSKADPFNSLDNLVQGAQVKDNNFGIDNKQTQQVAAIEKVVDAGAKLIASGHDLAKVQALVASGVTSINDLYAKEADQLRQKNIAQVKAYTESLHDQLATRQQLLDLQVSAVGMGAKEAQQQQQLLAIDQQYNRQKAALLRQQNNSTSAIQREFFQQELDALDASHEAERQSTKDHWAKMDAAQAIGLNGMKSAINDFLDRERDMAAQTKQFTMSFIDGFGNAFASFIDGTASAKKAFGSFIDSMYQQAVKFLADKTIQALFDSFGGGAKQTAGTTAGGFASFFGNLGNDLGLLGSLGPGTIGAGLALGGPVAPGSLHPVNEDGPEIYTTGGKTYLMAGAEPGRVTPLSSGKAGVTVNQTIVVSGLVNRQTRSQLAQQTAQRQRIAMARNG